MMAGEEMLQLSNTVAVTAKEEVTVAAHAVPSVQVEAKMAKAKMKVVDFMD